MLRVMTIVGTRPEVIRLSRIIPKLDEYCDHILVHTGQNYDYELNEVFFAELKIRKPNEILNSAGGSAGETIGRVIMESDRVLRHYRPDALLLLGDTNSSLAVIAAKRLKVPIFHMEAGNRCFDLRVPEEVNRKIVDHTSDINLTYSDIARQYLLREGFPPDQVIKTGSPMREVIGHYLSSVCESSVLESLDLAEQQYFVVSAHREETVDSPHGLACLLSLLDDVGCRYSLPIIFSAHPRTVARMQEAKAVVNPMIRVMKPFGFFDYIKLQINARCVLSDSGTITEESSILNFPALNIREVHERPEGFEEGAVMMVGLSPERVLQAIAILDDQPRGNSRLLDLVNDYAATNVSDKVLRIILSYTDFVNRRVWNKQSRHGESSV